MTSARKSLRYKPDQLDSAMVMFHGDSPGWEPDEIALIVDESALSGAQLVMRFNDRIKPSQVVKVKLGKLEPLRAEVAWRKEIASDLFRIGIKFLE